MPGWPCCQNCGEAGEVGCKWMNFCLWDSRKGVVEEVAMLAMPAVSFPCLPRATQFMKGRLG